MFDIKFNEKDIVCNVNKLRIFIKEVTKAE